MTGVAVSTEGLGRRYGRRWALKDCTVSLPAGSVTGLVGANGAGKTTFLRLVAGLSAPTSGTVMFDGRPRRLRRPADLARVALLPQGAPVQLDDRGRDSPFRQGDEPRLGRSVRGALPRGVPPAS